MDELTIPRTCGVDEVGREKEDEAVEAHLKVATEKDFSASCSF